jgi:hypothetical protein
MAKKETVKEFTSASGTKYKFQKVTPIAWLELMDDAEVNGAPKRAKLYPAVLENVVVQPQVTVNDFDDMAELDEVVTAAIRFQSGK